MMKPQFGWWSKIDNSYYPFVPDLTLDRAYSSELVQAIKDKQANPEKYKNYEFGDHRLQKDLKSLPHPYQQEIEDFDNEVKMTMEF